MNESIIMIFSTKESNVDAMEGLQEKAVGEQQHRALDKRRGNAMANSIFSILQCY
jgi:hypothetical protein